MAFNLNRIVSINHPGSNRIVFQHNFIRFNNTTSKSLSSTFVRFLLSDGEDKIKNLSFFGFEIIYYKIILGISLKYKGTRLE